MLLSACVWLDCCAAEFGSSGGTYELPCTLVEAGRIPYVGEAYVSCAYFTIKVFKSSGGSHYKLGAIGSDFLLRVNARGQSLRDSRGWGSQISSQSAHEGGKIALHTGRLYPRRKYFCYSFLLGAESNPRAIVRSEGLCRCGNFSDKIGNRTRDLPACSAVPPPTNTCSA
jgi:hypothetical protein